MTANLNSSLGETVTVQLPASLAEVPLNRYIDFIVECRGIGDPSKNQVSVMARAAGAFYGTDLELMVKRTLQEDPHAEIVGLDRSLNTLYAHALNLVSDAAGKMVAPDKSEINYMGDVYRIPAFVQESISGALPVVTVIEAIECAEIRRVTAQTVESRGNPNGSLRKIVLDLMVGEVGPGKMPPKEVMERAEKFIQEETAKRGDPDGSLMFTMYLHLLAVLLRKEWEQMPIGDAEREIWITERAAHLQHIDAQTALNLDFFLLHISRGSEQSPDAIGFLSRPMMQILVETQLRLEKPNPTLKRKMQRSFKGLAGGKSQSFSSKKGGLVKSKKSTAQTLKTR